MTHLSLLFVLSLLPFGEALARQDDEALEQAWENFLNAEIDIRKAVVDQIDEEARRSEHPQLAPLVDRAMKARRGLRIKPIEPPQFYDPSVYARKEAEAGRAERQFLARSDRKVEELANLYRPWDNLPPLHTELIYDFPSGTVRSSPQPLAPNARLENALEGWPPYADALIASLCKQWDFRRREFEKYAEHFGHAYCDLEGNAYPTITLYDALASQEGLDMPDVDVIPFARQILRDRSYSSPIPAGARRERLYRRIKDSFLPYFQHRSFVETAALLFLNPEAEYRADHEGMRQNLLYAFAAHDEDPAKVLALLRRGGDRGGFMDETLQLVKSDPSWSRKVQAFKSGRLEQRWEMHRIARRVLAEHGLLVER